MSSEPVSFLNNTLGKELECPVSLELLTEAVNLHPCNHKIQEYVLDKLQKKECPTCSKIIINAQPDHTIRNCSKSYEQYLKFFIEKPIAIRTIHIKPPFIKFCGYSTNSGKPYREFELDPKKLDPSRVYYFSDPDVQLVDVRIATMVEYITFHPETERNHLFDRSIVNLGSSTYLLTSIPKKYEFVLVNAAQTFNATIKHKSRMTLDYSQKIIMKTPESDNIVTVRTSENQIYEVGSTLDDKAQLEQDLREIKDMGDSLLSIELD